MNDLARTRSLFRHADGDREFVVDTRYLPLVVTTWFGSPSLSLVEAYDRWLRQFVERSLVCERKVVLLDDASRAERPVPQVRGRLAQLDCPAPVIVARVIVVQTPAIRGAVTALSWITGRTLRTVETIEDGVQECLGIFSQRKIEPPRKFEIVPALPSSPA